MGAGAITGYSYQAPHISISASLHCAHSVLILSAFHLSITYLFHTALPHGTWWGSYPSCSSLPTHFYDFMMYFICHSSNSIVVTFPLC